MNKIYGHGLTRIKHGYCFSFYIRRHHESYCWGSFELKVAIVYRPEDDAQLLYELKATGTEAGLPINFGTPKEAKRLVFSNQSVFDPC
jgi:hypothetical protein